jgi:hypothetical protein
MRPAREAGQARSTAAGPEDVEMQGFASHEINEVSGTFITPRGFVCNMDLGPATVDVAGRITKLDPEKKAGNVLNSHTVE